MLEASMAQSAQQYGRQPQQPYGYGGGGPPPGYPPQRFYTPGLLSSMTVMPF
jgi:hypothetical protein